MESQGEATGETLAAPSGEQGPKDQPNIYEDRPGTKKIIRIITVMAYLISVSFVAIVLSAYYVFLWQPPPPRLIARPRTMDKAHSEYLIQDAETTSVPDIFYKINLFKNEILRQRGINRSESFAGINEAGKSVITSQKPMEPTQMSSDKVKLGTWTGVYDFIHSHIPSGNRDTSLEASTMFNRSLTSDVTTSNDFYKAPEKNKMLLGRRISADDSHHPTTRSTVDSTLGQSMEPSMFEELQRDRTTSSLNDTQLMTDQLRPIDADKDLNKNNTLENLPLFNSTTNKKQENQQNFPKR